jgi:AcrR family transcriptional regulator
MARSTSAAPAAKNRPEESGREAIMDVAERLFAERGIDAVSLRTINSEAGYSVAALHYHFGSRDGLVRALLARAQPPMLEARNRMLTALAAKRAPTLREIVDALIRPLAVGMPENISASAYRLRFLSRLFFDRSPYLASTLEEGLQLFMPLLTRTLPHLDAGLLKRRWLFAIEIAQHALANSLELHIQASQGSRSIPATAVESFLCELADFIAGGLERRAG